MIRTWWATLLTDANERILAPDDLSRIEAYYRTVPDRLKAAESLEMCEGGLAEEIYSELRKRHPDRPAYTRRLAHDLSETLRVVAQAMLADEPGLLDRQLTDHVRELVAGLMFPAEELRDAFAVLREKVMARLNATASALTEPYFARLVSAAEDPSNFEGE